MHVVGAGLAIAGAVLLILAFTVLDWLSSGGLATSTGSGSGFHDIHDVLSLGDLSGQVDSRFVAGLYYTWGAWALLVVGVGASVMGNVAAAAGQSGRAPGVVAIVVGLLGIAATATAIDLFSAAGDARVPTYGDYLTHVGPAFFCAVAGFVAVTSAGVAAARRPASRADAGQTGAAAS